MSKVRGISIVNLITEYPELFNYFKSKLSHALTAKKVAAEKERQDMAIFSILLLTSRLIQYSFSSPAETEDEKLLRSEAV